MEDTTTKYSLRISSVFIAILGISFIMIPYGPLLGDTIQYLYALYPAIGLQHILAQLGGPQSGADILQVFTLLGLFSFVTAYGLWRARSWVKYWMQGYTVLTVIAIIVSIQLLATSHYSFDYPAFVISGVVVGLLSISYFAWLFFFKSNLQEKLAEGDSETSLFNTHPHLYSLVTYAPVIFTVPVVLIPFVKATTLFMLSAGIFFALSLGIMLLLRKLSTAHSNHNNAGWTFIFIGASIVLTSLIVTLSSIYTTYGFAKLEMQAMLPYAAPFYVLLIIACLVAANTNKNEQQTSAGAISYWASVALISIAIIVPYLVRYGIYFRIDNAIKIPLLSIKFLFS